MEIPFTYGKIADKKAFTNRHEELKRLEQNFTSLTHTILISPRRWGKSSLVKKAAQAKEKRDKQYRACFIDLHNIRTEAGFYQTLAETVINTTNNKIEDTLKLLRSIFKTIMPKVSISPDPGSEISLAMDWQTITQNPSEILQLPERIAKKKNLKLIICLDEFQNIAQFQDPLAFQKTIRATWQHHQSISYCLYGSKRHMMLELFSSPNMPFYKFGDLIFLEKIATSHWIRFIQNQFSRNNKEISRELAAQLIGLVDNHSYYVQQLAQIVWLRTVRKCNEQIITESFEGLQLQLGLLFQQMTEGLSNRQISFLHGLIDGAENLSSKASIAKYKLGTSGTVNKVKRTLQDKEILDLHGGEVTFNDPVYQHWLKNYYFT